MRASILFAVPFLAAGAFAQEPIPSNPAEQFLTQTDANGVVTGQPAVETSQPAVVTDQPANPPAVISQPPVVTSQPLPASLPIFGDGTHTYPIGNSTTIIIAVSSGDQTSIVTPQTTTADDSEGTASPTNGEDTTGTNGGASQPSDTGAAAPLKMASGALIGAGAFIAALL